MKNKQLYEWFEHKHRLLWGHDIAIERKDKEQAFKELEGELSIVRKRLTTPLQRESFDLAVRMRCFACGGMLLKTRILITDSCTECPVDWQNPTNYCLKTDSYYEQYYNAVSKSRRVTVKCARIAKKISKLRWKKWEEK